MQCRRIKFVVIKESKIDLSVTRKCQILNINKSSYYKWLKAVDLYDDTLDKLVINIFNKHKGTYGKKRIVISLRNMGYVVNHKKVYRIMRKYGLKARIRRKWKVGKYIKHNIYDNILDRNFATRFPNEKYTSDVTQLKSINNKKYYLYPVVDLYNNEIKAYGLHTSNDNYLVLSTLEKVDLSNVKIIHSDQGSQFTSKMYSHHLSQYPNLQISMSHVGECYDNAQMESIFSHIKDDFYIFYNPQTEDELYSNMKDYINYYNNERIQTRLKMSPIQYRTQNT